MDTSEAPLAGVVRFYEDKLAQFGDSPLGAGWNGVDAQRLRFRQLERLLPRGRRFSIADLGCGPGALADFLGQRGHEFDYIGYDVSERMIECARRTHAGRAGVAFAVASRPLAAADYCVASGIFNVPAGRDRGRWESHIDATLDLMHEAGRLGFAFNCLTSYSDPERMTPDLYYGDPLRYFDFCKRKYSRNVALLHDYDLYDFTVLVRKEAAAP